MDRTNGAGHINHLFVTEDAATARPPTEITETWLNDVQEELVNTVLAAGLVPAPNNRTQVRDAILSLISAQVQGISSPELTAIAASTAGNALTLSILPQRLTFRDAALSSGLVNQRIIAAPIFAVISAGSTAGTVSAIPSRLYVAAIDVGGTVEVAWINATGATPLDEAGLISTFAEGGAGGADSLDVWYSTTARANVPFRLVGYVESTQAVAGVWAAAPTVVQGGGGRALADINGVGVRQAYQDVTASRVASTIYYNTTASPIFVSVTATSGSGPVSATITVDGILAAEFGSGDFIAWATVCAIVPPGSSYFVNAGQSVRRWVELR